MQRSLFTAVSGLRNHQVKMDVIGNNIANVNTTAFKGGRVRFQDILSQNIRGASAPQLGRGGINPAQVGLGMSIGAIDTIHNQGSLQNTGRLTDLAIQGNGFFVMSDGTSQFYTRDGAFSVGADGDLVNAANGFKPLGWAADAAGNIDTTSPLRALNIPIGNRVNTRATENLVLGGNLDALTVIPVPPAPPSHTAEVVAYDSQGGMHTIAIALTKTAANTWSWAATSGAHVMTAGSNGTLNFDAAGNLTASAGGPIGFSPPGVAPLSIAADFSGLTQVVGRSSALVRSQDGFPVGELESFMIGNTGVINGVYTNGLVVALGQVALAGFPNPEGLQKAAANMFQISSNSGQPRIGGAGLEGRGTIETATLEMSNVDLSVEFTEMITTSRAFQANSRMISASDELLQEVVNLKR
ncbi:MAG: flagellar hook protein FlgE [Firmicutes bacterium]|nr:flagellar hook protein FlgE [Bacillota bacterium]MCL5992681.1 flagellar hook protein FlgE [Bacillota bacterium]